VIIGDKLGLFRLLSQGAATSAELADKTGAHERYVREWLSRKQLPARLAPRSIAGRCEPRLPR